MKPSRARKGAPPNPRHEGPAGARRPGLSKALRRALLLALSTPFAIPVACALQAESTSATGGSTTTASSTAGAGGGTQTGTGGGTTDAGTGGDPCDPLPYTGDAADDCGVFVRLPCGVPPDVVQSGDCYLPHNDCTRFCGALIFSCRAIDESCVDGGVVPDPEGGVNLDCATCVGGLGRVPEGLGAPRLPVCPSEVGAYLARAAHLEAASIVSFRRLEAELTAHGAPESLVRRARVAARDEVRHARATARLARRFGAAPPRARVKKIPTRPLPAVALENAVEGCIRETFGAAVAAFQAERASDPEIRSVLRTIAKDEARHAALSWSVARWAEERLSPDDRARLAAARRQALSRLEADSTSPVPAPLTTTLGLPTPAQQRALITALEQDLWSKR